MKARQEKKNFKKAIRLMNDINVEDWDAESEGLLYVYVEDNSQTRQALKSICGLLKIDHINLTREINKNQEEDLYSEPLVDLVQLYMFLKVPKKRDIFFNGANGFSLKPVPQELL
jgi:hypothetical protein